MSNNLSPINQFGVIQTPVMTSNMVKIQSRTHSRKKTENKIQMVDVHQQLDQSVNEMDGHAPISTEKGNNQDGDQNHSPQMYKGKMQLALPTKSFAIGEAQPSPTSLRQQENCSSIESYSPRGSPRLTSSKLGSPGPPNLSNKLQRHAAKNQRLMLENKANYTTAATVNQMVLTAPEYNHLNEQHWKQADNNTHEKVKMMTRKQVPFSSSNDFVDARQTSTSKEFTTSRHQTSSRNEVSNRDSKGEEYAYQQERSPMQTSWQALATALNTQQKRFPGEGNYGPGPHVKQMHQLETTMDKHIGYYFKQTGKNIDNSKNSIRSYLSRRFMQQKRAEDMRNVDRRRPSLSLGSHLGSMPQSHMPSSVGSKGFNNWNLDISRKMELGKSFRPPNNEYRDDDDFEKELDMLNTTQSNMPLTEMPDVKARTFSHGVNRAKPNLNNIQRGVQRPDKINDSFQPSENSYIRMGGTAPAGKTGMTNKSRSMRHQSQQRSSQNKHKEESSESQTLFEEFKKRLREQNNRQALNDGFGGVCLNQGQTRTGANSFFEDQDKGDSAKSGHVDLNDRQSATQEAEDKLKFNRMIRQQTLTLREVIKVPAEGRTRDERFFLRMHLRQHVPFFCAYSGFVLQNICDKLQQKVFDRGQIIARKGTPNQSLVIILFGKAGVYADDECQHNEKELLPNQFFGEKALKEVDTYAVNIIAHKVCVCLILDKNDFDEQVFYLVHQQKMERYAMLQKMPNFEAWANDKLKELNANMTEQKIVAGEIIFDIGARAENLYIVKKGCISLECEIEVEEKNRCPVGNNTWEVIKTKRKVMFELTKFREGQIFGHQELISIIDSEKEDLDDVDFRGMVTRQTRAVAACASEIICVNIELFMRMFDKPDIDYIKDTCFNFKPDEAIVLIRRMFAQQRHIDYVVADAAKKNVMATAGDGVTGISQIMRDRKRDKLSNWIHLRNRKASQATKPALGEQSNIEAQDDGDERPRFRPVDMIKVLDVNKEKQVITKTPSRRILVVNSKVPKNEPRNYSPSIKQSRTEAKKETNMTRNNSNSDLSVGVVSAE